MHTLTSSRAIDSRVRSSSEMSLYTAPVEQDSIKILDYLLTYLGPLVLFRTSGGEIPPSLAIAGDYWWQAELV